MKTLRIFSGDIYSELNSKFGRCLPFLISAKDLNGNVVFANDHFDILDGPGFSEFIGKNIYDLFPFEVAHELWMNDVAAIEGECVIKEIERVKHSDGEWYEYLTLKMPLINSFNDVIGTAAFSIRTPEIASLETHNNDCVTKDLDSVVRMFKHELMTPLNAIHGFSQLLRDQVSIYQNEMINELVQHIFDASEHMNAIISNEKYSTAKIPSEQSRGADIFDLVAVCNQCKAWVEGMALKHKRSIVFRSYAPEVIVVSSKLDVRQIILNFLTNAIKYSIGSGPVVMQLSLVDKESIKVGVSNSGKQISDEELLHIFDMDYRLDRHENIEGHGLGLSIVKKKLETLGCMMGVDSNNSGVNTFWFNIKKY